MTIGRIPGAQCVYKESARHGAPRKGASGAPKSLDSARSTPLATPISGQANAWRSYAKVSSRGEGENEGDGGQGVPLVVPVKTGTSLPFGCQGGSRTARSATPPPTYTRIPFRHAREGWHPGAPQRTRQGGGDGAHDFWGFTCGHSREVSNESPRIPTVVPRESGQVPSPLRGEGGG